MELILDSLLEGARRARGTVIIVDVFRAFTTAAVAFSKGAKQIVLVAEVEEALALRDRGVGEICMGEVAGKRPDGFDFGNSPYGISRADVDGKTIIQSTRAGTVGMAAASHAERLYGGSFAVASATVDIVSRFDPDVVTIVAMGSEGRVRTDEDEQCGLYLRNLFQGRRPNCASVRALVLAGQEAQKYGDPDLPHFPIQDRDMALEIDSHEFAIRVRRQDGLLIAEPEFA